MRRLRWIIPLLMVLMLAVLVAAPFTATGTRLAVAAVNTVPGLYVQHRSGTLLGDLELEAVRFATLTIEIDVSDVRARLDRACLWESRLCFDRLAARSLRVMVPESEAEAPDADTEEAFFHLPFGIRAPQLELGSTEVRWPGGSWQTGEIDAGIAFRGESIRIRRLVIPEATLDLGGFDDPAAPERLALPSLFLPLDLRIVEGRLDRGEVLAAGQMWQLNKLVLSAQWRGQQLQLSQLSSQLPGWGEGVLSGELQFSEDWPLAARLAVQFANGDALPESLHNRDATLTGDGSLGALAWSLALPGTSSLNAEGELDLLEPGLPFSAGAELAWREPEALNSLVSLPPALLELQPQSPLTLTASGDTGLQAFTLRMAASGINYEDLQVEIRGAHQEGVVTVEGLELTETATASSLSARGQLSFDDTVSWRLMLDSPGLTLPALSSYVSGRIEGSARVAGGFQGDDWQSLVDDVEVSGIINGLPATASGTLEVNSQELVVSGGFDAEVNGAEVSVSKRKGEGGRLDLSVADLGRWLPGSEGSLDLDATLAADGPDTIAFAGRVASLQWQDMFVAEINLSGRGDLADDMPFEIMAIADGIALGRMSSEQAQLSLRGDTRNVSGSLTMSGDVEGSLQLTARAEEGLWQGSLATGGLTTPAGAWRTANDVAFAFDTPASTLSVSAHCWRSDGSSICIDNASVGDTGSVGAELDLELALLEFLLPPRLSVSGRAVGRTDASWGDDSVAEVSALLDVARARLEQQLPEGEIASFSLDSVRLALDTGEGGSGLQVSADREGKQVVSVDLRLAPDPDEAVTGTMTFDDFRLAALRPFVPQLSRLSGQLDGNLELYGSVRRPLLRGSAEVNDGYLTVVGNPNALENLSLAITFDGEEAVLAGNGQLGSGPATVAGTAGWGAERRLVLRLEGQRNRLLVPPYSELLVSSAFDMQITPELVNVEGQVTVHEGRLEHEQLPAGSVAVSNDVIEVDYAGNVLREKAPIAVRSRVRVVIKDDFRVVGTNIDATVGGDIRLEQDPERPMQVFGTLNVIGGEVRAYGQRLNVAQGTIDFSGDPDNPQLNLRAERDIPRERVRVGVIVTGTLEEPLLEIYSDPSMPPTAALSWLVRGRGPDSGAGADGTAMAIAMGASAINQTGVVSEINRIPGVSNVGFGAEGTEDDTAATVSGYIGERIYLSYGVGIYEPINILTARLYLQARLWLEVVSRLENSLDLYYSFDID